LTNQKFSKGPFSIQRSGTGEIYIASDKSPDPGTEARFTFIARVLDFTDAYPLWEWPDKKEVEANALLFAASPEMYDALKRLINCHTGAKWQTEEVQREAWLAAMAALDKADGK
jgi:hypothetical protein